MSKNFISVSILFVKPNLIQTGSEPQRSMRAGAVIFFEWINDKYQAHSGTKFLSYPSSTHSLPIHVNGPPEEGGSGPYVKLQGLHVLASLTSIALDSLDFDFISFLIDKFF